MPSRDAWTRQDWSVTRDLLFDSGLTRRAVGAGEYAIGRLLARRDDFTAARVVQLASTYR